jgi:hypothetical protein
MKEEEEQEEEEKEKEEKEEEVKSKGVVTGNFIWHRERAALC